MQAAASTKPATQLPNINSLSIGSENQQKSQNTPSPNSNTNGNGNGGEESKTNSSTTKNDIETASLMVGSADDFAKDVRTRLQDVELNILE